MGKISDEIQKLRSEVEALAAPKTPSWSHWSPEKEQAFVSLCRKWERGEDLGQENPKEVAYLDKIGPIAIAVCDKNRRHGTVEEYAERYLPPQAAQARRRRMEGR